MVVKTFSSQGFFPGRSRKSWPLGYFGHFAWPVSKSQRNEARGGEKKNKKKVVFRWIQDKRWFSGKGVRTATFQFSEWGGSLNGLDLFTELPFL